MNNTSALRLINDAFFYDPRGLGSLGADPTTVDGWVRTISARAHAMRTAGDATAREAARRRLGDALTKVATFINRSRSAPGINNLVASVQAARVTYHQRAASTQRATSTRRPASTQRPARASSGSRGPSPSATPSESGSTRARFNQTISEILPGLPEGLPGSFAAPEGAAEGAPFGSEEIISEGGTSIFSSWPFRLLIVAGVLAVGTAVVLYFVGKQKPARSTQPPQLAA